MSRGNGRRNGGQLEMTQDTRDHWFLRLQHGQSARHMADQTASLQQAGEAMPLAAAGPETTATRNF